MDPRETVWSSAFMPVVTAGERLLFQRNPYFGEWNVDERGNPLPYLDGITTTLVGPSEPELLHRCP